VRFSSLHWNEFDACPPNCQFGSAVNGDVRFEAAHFVNAVALAEEILVESAWLVDVLRDFFRIIASRVEAHPRTQPPKIRMPANMVPVRVRDKDGCKFGQVGRIRSQCFIGGLGRVRSRTRVNADQLSLIIRYDEVVLRELETGEHIYAARDNLAD